MTDFLFGKVNISIFCTVEWSLAFHLEIQYNAAYFRSMLEYNVPW